MIVRILEEGQLELPAEAIDELNTLDDDLIAAVEAGDEARFSQVLSGLLARVREVGTPVPLDHLGPSEIFLPSADATIDEVRAFLADHERATGSFRAEPDRRRVQVPVLRRAWRRSRV